MIASVCLLFGTYRKYKYFYNGKLDWDQRSSKGKYVRENCKRLKVGMFTKWKGKTYWKNFIQSVSIHMINLLWNNFFLLSINKKDLRICVLFVVLCVVEMTFFIGLKFDNLISIYSLINTAYVFYFSDHEKALSKSACDPILLPQILWKLLKYFYFDAWIGYSVD